MQTGKRGGGLNDRFLITPLSRDVYWWVSLSGAGGIDRWTDLFISRKKKLIIYDRKIGKRPWEWPKNNKWEAVSNGFPRPRD